MIQSVLAAVMYVVQNISNKMYSEHFKNSVYTLMVFNAIALALGTAILAALMKPAMIPAEGMLFALAFGVLFVLTITMIVVTMSRGPLGPSGLIIDMNIVITVLFGALFWKEPLTPVQLAALMILLTVIVLLALPEQKETARMRIGWLLTALLTMLLNGALNIVQASAFMVCENLSSSDFTFWSLLMGMPVCLLLAGGLRLFAGARLDRQEPLRKLPLIATGQGVGTAVAYYFHNEALLLLPSVIVFPVVVGVENGLLTLSSILFFKEKFTLRKGVALGLGLIGILMINM